MVSFLIKTRARTAIIRRKRYAVSNVHRQMESKNEAICWHSMIAPIYRTDIPRINRRDVEQMEVDLDLDFKFLA